MASSDDDHLSESGVYKGVLSRNSTYKRDARGRMIAQGIYGKGKYPIVLTAIKKRDASQGRPDGRWPSGKLIKDKTQSQRAHTYRITYQSNFKAGYSAEPYPHQAHHVLPCEVFYDEKKWTVDHLDVLMKVKYDINNNKNLIYLPQGEKGRVHLCDYHQLPNHAKGHNRYNNRLKREANKVWMMIDKIVKKKICPIPKAEKDKILNKLQEIEKNNFQQLKSMGALPMPG